MNGGLKSLRYSGTILFTITPNHGGLFMPKILRGYVVVCLHRCLAGDSTHLITMEKDAAQNQGMKYYSLTADY